MIFNRFIIIFFVASLLSSNVLWAGEGALDHLLDSSAALANDSDILDHVEVQHHDGHDCHMSAHLVGLNSNILVFADYHSAQILPIFIRQFTSIKSPPPNKPPRA